MSSSPDSKKQSSAATKHGAVALPEELPSIEVPTSARAPARQRTTKKQHHGIEATYEKGLAHAPPLSHLDIECGAQSSNTTVSTDRGKAIRSSRLREQVEDHHHHYGNVQPGAVSVAGIGLSEPCDDGTAVYNDDATHATALGSNYDASTITSASEDITVVAELASPAIDKEQLRKEIVEELQAHLAVAEVNGMYDDNIYPEGIPPPFFTVCGCSLSKRAFFVGLVAILLVVIAVVVGSIVGTSSSSTTPPPRVRPTEDSLKEICDWLNESPTSCLTVERVSTGTGQIPSEIGLLTQLKHIQIVRKFLTGTIPSEIGLLTQLTHISFAKNEMQGTIPSEIGMLRHVEYLRLFNNTLTGTIPSEIGSMTKLLIFSVSGNTLTGSIPSTLYNLSRLTGLFLYANKDLGGTIPETFCLQADSTDLEIDCSNVACLCCVQGTEDEEDEASCTPSAPSFSIFPAADPTASPVDMPDSTPIPSSNPYLAPTTTSPTEESSLMFICNWLDESPTACPTVERVSTGTGQIPSEIGLLTQLKHIQMVRKSLTGTIPSEVGLLTQLTHISFADNELQGTIPSEIGMLRDMEFIRLFNNNLNGILPSEIGSMTKLRILSVSGNELTGSVPSTLSSLSQLTGLYLHTNKDLGGTIPETFCLQADSTDLEIDCHSIDCSCCVQGADDEADETSCAASTPSLAPSTSPTEASSLLVICDWLNESPISCPTVERVTTGTGQIPSEIGLLTQLQDIQLVRKSLTGTIPSELGLLTQLTQLSFANNELQGAIPSEVGMLRKVEYIRIFNNKLTGTIPSEIGSMTQLIIMSISGNALAGSIPPTLSNLSRLTGLFLYGNEDLGGTIPETYCLQADSTDLEIDCDNIDCACCVQGTDDEADETACMV